MESIINTNIALLILQTVHTLVYVAGQASVLLILWCGFTGRQHAWFRLAMLCLSLILMARAANGGICPLYTMAQWLVDAQPGEIVQDMLTPIWFNNLVTPVNIPLGALGVLLITWRSYAGRWRAPIPEDGFRRERPGSKQSSAAGLGQVGR